MICRILAPAHISVASAAPADCVVLRHGLVPTEDSLPVLAAALEVQGHALVNHGPAATAAPVAVLAAALGIAVARCPAGARLHFVTHALAGRPGDIYRAEMPGPPSQGSERAAQLGEIGTFEWINGPAGLHLGTGADALPGSLPLLPAGSALISGPDDGKVAVKSTKVKGTAGWLVLPVTHSFMMMNPVEVGQTVLFLRDRGFATDLSLGEAVEIVAGGGT